MKHTNFDGNPDDAPRFRACSVHAMRKQRRVRTAVRSRRQNAQRAPSSELPPTRMLRGVTRTQFYENSLLRILESVN